MKFWNSTIYCALWMALVATGMTALLAYSSTPGDTRSEAPQVWPSASSLALARSVPTLLMFVHPKCPCTRASLTELELLMASSQKRVRAKVVVVKPHGAGPDWTQTDLCRRAGGIPGVSVEVDEDGTEARRFHATTSGHVLLYDGGGHLVFSGGITSSRGHEGDSVGLSDLVNLLHGRPAESTKQPVFGCSLLNPSSVCLATNLCTR